MTASGSNAESDGGSSAPTILIVDDEAATRVLLRKTVESSGCRTIEAADGDSALAMARSARPDLVLLDIVLPGSTTSGVLLCREMLQELGLKVVVVSGNATGTIAQSCLTMGVTDILRKPFSVDVLREKLPGWLES
jgi:CheY-like chemotaxis protein